MATVTSSKRHLVVTSDTYTSNGDVTIGGNLEIQGTTTTIDTANLLVEDKNIIIGNVSSPSDTTANGGGITLKGTSDYTIIWNNSDNEWKFNQGIDITSGNLTLSNGNITLSGTVDGRDVATDGAKLDNIDANANNYSLPLGTSTTRGGFKIGYSENGKNYPVEISNEKMYVNVPWTDTNTVYTHPTHPGDDFSVDTGALTGAVVVSDIDINVTTDTLGHVTDANGSVSTRTLTLADLGYTGATNANYITNNNQLTNGAGYITSYVNTVDMGDGFKIANSAGTDQFTVTENEEIRFAGSGATSVSFDASTQKVTISSTDTNTVYTHPTHPGDDISIDTGALTGATVISDLDFNVTTDTLGHVTDANATVSTRNLTAADIGAAASSHNHDSTYLKLSGGTMTGGLTIGGSLSRGTYTAASNYHAGADNIVLKGNASGISGIFFESEKDGTNINHATDFGFIQFHPYGTGTSGESNELIIGVSNDSDDHLIFNAPNAEGFRVRVGSSETDYKLYHEGHKPTWSEINSKPSTFTPSSHTHSASDITSGTFSAARIAHNSFDIGDTTAETGRSVHETGIYTFNRNNGNLGTGTNNSYYSVLAYGQGTGGSAQIATEWTNGGNKLYFRSLRDTTDNWWDWKEIYHTGHKPTLSEIGAAASSHNHDSTYLKLSGGTISGNLTVTGTTNTSTLVETSARKYKENIISLQDQLDSIKKLEPVEFRWKETKKKDIGFIAEDIEKIYPHLVEHDDNGDLIGVKYSKLTTVLVKALQQQQDQIDELKKEIFILKQQR